MTLYHAFEIIVVVAIVGACSISVTRRYWPGLLEWLHLGPKPGDAKPAANCSSSGCNGCAPNNKSTQH